LNSLLLFFFSFFFFLEFVYTLLVELMPDVVIHIRIVFASKEAVNVEIQFSRSIHKNRIKMRISIALKKHLKKNFEILKFESV
jgi:hypothetical protein